MRRLVVAGNGMVGQRFVEALRERDTAGQWRVTVLAEEPRPAYDRVRLSAYVDGADEADLSLHTPDDDVTLRLAEPVRRIDRRRRVAVTDRDAYPYDALVLATGSYPFVPPVDGRDRPGVFVYRTLADLAAIRAYAARLREAAGGSGPPGGAVIGGGLLGLEAANALRLLGLTTHVVEVAPRLMPLQVDEAGGALLRRYVEDLGVSVHTGTATTEVVGDPTGATAGLVLADGRRIDAGLVVVAAGVRPRDELARAAGLPVAPRGGVLVDDTCRTADPAVWAVGECAAIAEGARWPDPPDPGDGASTGASTDTGDPADPDAADVGSALPTTVAGVPGRCYGLVAPGYAMAEVVADRLVAGRATFPGADTSSKLKLLGVEVASFGEPMVDGPTGPDDDRLAVTWLDPATRTYAKLVLSDDAGTLLGGVLVGDASAYPTLRASLGGPLPGPPLTLLAPTGGDATAGGLPDHAQVCSCHAVTKQQITGAIADGCVDVPAVKQCTRAGTGCGSCVPLVKQLLTEAGVAGSKALCEHFDHSRQELFDIVRVRGVRTFSELITGFGRGRGCDICKPAVASILAATGGGHILDGEQAALQDTNDHFLANLQRNGSYSVVPRIPGGEITAEKLIVIGEVAREFGLYVKITGGQRIDMFGARVDQLPAIWRRLVDAGFESGHAYGKALRTVKSCVGSAWCRYGQHDSVALAVALELRYRGLRAPHKIKAAVSGCARECAEARSKDFGVIATEQGWNLYVGGNGGFRPRHADLLAGDLSTEELIRTVDRFLMYYIRTADRLQRTAGWLEGLDGGLDHLRAVIIDDSLGLAAELDAAMAGHIASYEDEWRATLSDPERLRRFVSFVNAPDVPDPSITFETEREQPVPPGGRRLALPLLTEASR